MRTLAFAISIMFVTFIARAGSLPETDREKASCGLGILEPAYFKSLAQMAGKADRTKVTSVSNLREVTFKTSDDRLLHGYHLTATSKERGVVLFAQGNAMLADQMVVALDRLTAIGLDVYVYDFRGYGESAGNPRLRPIVEDYEAIARALRSESDKRFFLYGVSFGGILVLNAAHALDGAIDGIILDSVPSKIGHHCPKEYDAVANLPSSARNILMVVGGSDNVVPIADSRELASKILAQGGDVKEVHEFAHPFMDPPEIEDRRFNIIMTYLKTLMPADEHDKQ